MLKSAVEQGIADIKRVYGTKSVRVVADGQGGAWVEIGSVRLSKAYTMSSSFLICLLPFSLPGADVYPVFLRHDLARRDKGPLGEGFQVTQLQWPGEPAPRPVVQVSRRTRNNFAIQTPLQKIEKVLEWVRTR